MAAGTCAIDVPDCNDTSIGDPGDPGDPGAGEPQIVEPTPGMDHVRQTAFDTATIGADDTTLTIVFWSGVEPCYVLDHVDVSYAADAVTVTLFQGSDPNAGDVACIDIALQSRSRSRWTSRSPVGRSRTAPPDRVGLADPDLPGRHGRKAQPGADTLAEVGRRHPGRPPSGDGEQERRERGAIPRRR